MVTSVVTVFHPAVSVSAVRISFGIFMHALYVVWHFILLEVSIFYFNNSGVLHLIFFIKQIASKIQMKLERIVTASSFSKIIHSNMMHD